MCTTEDVYKFIEAFEESSFTSLNLHEGDRVIGKISPFMPGDIATIRLRKHKLRENIILTSKLAKTQSVLVVTCLD